MKYTLTPRPWMMLCLMALAPCLLTARFELLKNGDFASVDNNEIGLPAGWSRVDDGTKGEIRLSISDSSLWLRSEGPGRAPTLRQEQALTFPPPAALMLEGEVKIAGIVRGERSWYSGRMLVTYLDENDRVLGETYTLDRLEGSSDWRAVRRQFPVPPEAKRVRMELQLLQPAAGSIGFRHISLSALDRDEAQAWRVEADERIRKFRTAPLVVRVEDEDGRPVAGAEVAVFMRRHAYPFGTAVRAALLREGPADEQTETYRSVVEHFFNYATLENALKVKAVESRGLESPLAALAWLRQRGIAARGHVLTWPSLEMSSKAENAAKDDPDALRAVMRRQFRERLQATGPFGVVDWDVLNEPTVHNDLLRILGDDQAAEWFRWAREDAPEARLYLNENNVEFAGGNRDGMEQWLRRLQSAGAPIGGIGWQGHMWHRTLPSGQNILDDLDHFAPYGLPVQITEYDAADRFSDEDEARFLDEFLTAWFSHPLTAGFIMWGFKDDMIWNGNAPLFRADWSLKPAGKVWMEHVFGRWWTEERGRTDATGAFAIRGFLGDYEIEAVMGGKRATATLVLSADGAKAVLHPLAEASDTTRLVSSNPYANGLLPKVRSTEPTPSLAREIVTVRADHGSGALGLSPMSDGLTLVGAEDPLQRRDLYARFDLSGLTARKVESAELRVHMPAGVVPAGLLRVYVLSNRFVPQGTEAGADWTAADLGPGRAPGRDVVTGDYRLGDASVIFMGEVSCATMDGEGVLTFSSSELARAVSGARAPGITVMLSAVAPSLELRAVELAVGLDKTAP